MIAYRDDVMNGGLQKSKQFCSSIIRSAICMARRSDHRRRAIGQSMAALGKAFGMRPIYAAHPASSTSRANCRAAGADRPIRCDHAALPLMPATRNMIGAAQLRSMKPSALLINTGVADWWMKRADPRTRRRLDRRRRVRCAHVEPPPAATRCWKCGGPISFSRRMLPGFTRRHAVPADQLMDNIDGWAAGKPQNSLRPPDKWHAASGSVRGQRRLRHTRWRDRRGIFGRSVRTQQPPDSDWLWPASRCSRLARPVSSSRCGIISTHWQPSSASRHRRIRCTDQAKLMCDRHRTRSSGRSAMRQDRFEGELGMSSAGAAITSGGGRRAPHIWLYLHQ